MPSGLGGVKMRLKDRCKVLAKAEHIAFEKKSSRLCGYEYTYVLIYVASWQASMYFATHFLTTPDI